MCFLFPPRQQRRSIVLNLVCSPGFSVLFPFFALFLVCPFLAFLWRFSNLPPLWLPEMPCSVRFPSPRSSTGFCGHLFLFLFKCSSFTNVVPSLLSSFSGPRGARIRSGGTFFFSQLPPLFCLFGGSLPFPFVYNPFFSVPVVFPLRARQLVLPLISTLHLLEFCSAPQSHLFSFSGHSSLAIQCF